MGVDWTKLTVSFEGGGKKVILRGDSSLTKKEVSLKVVTKSCEKRYPR